MKKAFEIKTYSVGLDDKEIKTEGEILNRLIRVDSNGWKLEADPRHAELLAEDLRVDKKGWQRQDLKREMMMKTLRSLTPIGPADTDRSWPERTT